jgi:hypothetical protein
MAQGSREDAWRGDGPPPGSGPVFRHGPGSGGSSSVSLGGSGPRRPAGPPDSGSFVFTSPASTSGSGTRAAGKKPTSRPATSQPAKGGRAADDAAERRPRRRKPLQFAGVPLGVWLVLGGGVVLAGVLAAMLFLRNQS